MPRKARLDSPGTLHHVIIQTTDRICHYIQSSECLSDKINLLKINEIIVKRWVD